MTVLSVLSFLLIGSLWAFQQYHYFNKQAELLKEKETDVRKSIIKKQVEDVLYYVKTARQRYEQQVHIDIQQKVNRASQVVSDVYLTNKAETNSDSFVSTVFKILSLSSFARENCSGFVMNADTGKGYYARFCEIQNLQDIADIYPVAATDQMLALCQSHAEGVYFSGIDSDEKPFYELEQFAYLRKAPGTPWVLGFSIAPADVDADVQAEVLDLIDKIRFGAEGYVFAGRWNGLSLSGPAKGRNMLDVTDINGIRIVQQLIELSQGAGGYLNYVMPDLEEGIRPSSKLSYTEGFPDWQWYIGAGVYLDDIQMAYEASQQDLIKQLSSNIFIAACFFILIVALTFVIERKMADRFSAAFRVFEGFFRKAADDLTEIRTDARLNFVEFRQLADSANEMIRRRAQTEKDRQCLLRQLTAKTEQLESVLHVMSHDLKSPLVNIQGFSGEILKSLDGMKQKSKFLKLPAEELTRIQKDLQDLEESLGYIRKSAQKLNTLIEALKKFCRIGRNELKMEPLDMNELVTNVEDSLRYQINQKNIEFIKEDLPSCYGDRQHLNQVFTNLIENAVKYMDKPSGRILIRGRSNGQCVVYSVHDTGMGMEKEHLNKIFEIFHRLNPEDETSGEGLGLTITRKIMSMHNGRIQVESEPGKGSAFHIIIPKIPEACPHGCPPVSLTDDKFLTDIPPL